MWFAIGAIAIAGAAAAWQGLGAVRDARTAPESEAGRVIVSSALPIALVVVGVVLLIALGRRG